MTCLSIWLTWYLVALGPGAPVIVRAYPTEAACWTDQALAKQSVTLTGRTILTVEWGTPVPARR